MSYILQTEDDLEVALSEPTPEVIELLSRLPGDFVVLGVAGKMGPTFARMIKRASDAARTPRRVIGVARFSSGNHASLEAAGVETIRCDLIDTDAVAQLPDAPNVVFMAGMKFGTTGMGNFELKSAAQQRSALAKVEQNSLFVAAGGAIIPAAGSVVRLVTADGWVYHYHVKSAAAVDDGRSLRIDIVEGSGLEFDAAKRHLELKSFTQRQHAGVVHVEWQSSATHSSSELKKP